MQSGFSTAKARLSRSSFGNIQLVQQLPRCRLFHRSVVASPSPLRRPPAARVCLWAPFSSRLENFRLRSSHSASKRPLLFLNACAHFGTMADAAASSSEGPHLTWALLQQQNADTSAAIIEALDGDETFLAASEVQAKAIRQRDEEDDEKLAKGIKAAIEKNVLPADLVPEEYKEIDVLGKTPDEVANAIIADVGEAAKTGCVIVMCGLSGTGKGTTVARLRELLPNAQTWSNGNIFRSLTLLCARWCAKESESRGEPVAITEALTPENLATFMKCVCAVLGLHEEDCSLGVVVRGTVCQIPRTADFADSVCVLTHFALGFDVQVLELWEIWARRQL